MNADQVELAREVLINGQTQTVRVRFPEQLIRFKSPQATALIERDFAEAIRNFQSTDGDHLL